MKRTIDHTLDLRETIEPIVFLKVTQRFRDMAPDETLEVLLRDAEVGQDLLQVLRSFSFELILTEESGFAHRIQIKKRSSR